MSIIVRNRNELNEIKRKRQSIPTLIKVDIPNFTPKEIVNLVLEYEGVADIWVRTSTLSVVSRQKWLKFKRVKKDNYHLKRAIDIILSLALLIVSLPLFLIIAIFIKFTSKGSVIFRQQRVNNELKIFNLYKFRTMNCSSENADIHKEFMRKSIKNPNPIQKVHKLIDDPRITGIGKWIRRTSVDELPQFINVLKGEMSLVGPRPPIPYEVKEYESWHYARFRAKPGITGLWQALGRSLVSFEEMVVLDLYYVYNRSMWLDLKILLHTIPTLLSLKGAF